MRLRPEFILPGFASLLAALACADGSDVSAVTAGVSERDSAGVTIVENTAFEVPAELAWRVSEEPILTIGAVSGAPEQQFAQIQGVARLSDGRIAVLEGQVSELRYFSASGRHLLTVGGTGPGPGEIGSAWALTRLPGDSLLVEDLYTAYVIFRPDGSFDREESFDVAALVEFGLNAPCIVLWRFRDRSRVACRERSDSTGAPVGETVTARGTTRRFVELVWVDGALTRPVAVGLSGGFEVHPELRGLHPLFAAHRVTGGGDPPLLFSAQNPEYAIEVWTPNGRLERVIRRIGAERPVDGPVLRILDEWSRGQSARDPEGWRRFESEVPVPEWIPAVFDLVSNEAGELLVRRTMTRERTVPSRWDAFDAEGHFAGSLELPPRFRVWDFGSDYVLGERRDDFDVPFVEMLELQRGGGL